VAAEGVWEVSMTTSDVRDAWTEGAEVAVVLCGVKRDSSVQPLRTDNRQFLRRGRTGNFTVVTLLRLFLIVVLFMSILTIISTTT